MEKKLKLQELMIKANNGDQEATVQLVHRFIPLIKKYSLCTGHEEIYADLIVWMVNAIYSYKPNTNYEKQEAE